MQDGRYRRRTRETLDAQLVGYWDREAARLDALAERARFGWIARRYRRKARHRVSIERHQVISLIPDSRPSVPLSTGRSSVPFFLRRAQDSAA